MNWEVYGGGRHQLWSDALLRFGPVDFGTFDLLLLSFVILCSIILVRDERSNSCSKINMLQTGGTCT